MHLNLIFIISLGVGGILILWLLKRFFYQPIIDDLNTREQNLQELLKITNNKIKHAKILQHNFDMEYQEFESQRALLIKKSHEVADDMLRKRLAAIQNELLLLQQGVIKKSIKEVYAIAHKMLTDLMSVELHEIMLSRFIERLNTLPLHQKSSLLSALKRSNNLVVIRSAHVLSENDKQKISQSLSTLLEHKYPIEIKFNFMLIPNFISGLEMNVSGWKLAWSIHQHLQTLQDNVRQSMQLEKCSGLDKPQSDMASFIAPKHTKDIQI